MRHFVEIFAEAFAADAVEHDVRRIRVQNGADVLRLAVDDDVRSDFAGGFRLAVVADGCDDLCAPGFSELRGGNAEAAGPRLDEDGVARLDARFELEVQEACGIDFRQGGRLDHRDAFRDGQQHGAVHGDFFRIAAAAEQRADRVADLPSADSLFADGFHDAGDFQPHPFRRSGRRRVVSCPLEKIRAVHGGAFDVDENFVVMHHGIGHFDPREALIVVDFDYVHGVFLLFTVKFFTEIFTII